MLRKFLSVSLVLVLAAAGLDLSAGAGQARPHGGGGHAGGGFHSAPHFSGFHAAPHFSGFHAAPNLGAFHAAPNLGGSRPAFRPGIFGSHRPGARQDGHPRGFGFGVRRPRIRAYPDAGYYGYYGVGPYSDYGSYDPGFPDDSDYGGSYGADLDGWSADYGQGSSEGLQTDPGTPSAGAISPQDDRAKVSMTLPADATLWAQGQKITGSGATREFQSPALKPGLRYIYDFQASWRENGHTVTQKQHVLVTGGAHVKVHFPVQENPQTAQSR